MTQTKPMDAFSGVVDILTPLTSDERARIIRAAMVFLGESETASDSNLNQSVEITGELSPRARAWMKQNSITTDELREIFHIAGGAAEVIAPHLPGKSKKEQTYNAYVLAGIEQLLVTGDSSFDDKNARALCERFGCYDSANHSAHLRDRGNEFTGTKEKGWTLTAPGLKRGGDLIKDMKKLGS